MYWFCGLKVALNSDNGCNRHFDIFDLECSNMLILVSVTLHLQPRYGVEFCKLYLVPIYFNV